MINLKRFAVAVVATIPMTLGIMSAKADDIVDTAIAAGQFNTLVAAVQAADLVGCSEKRRSFHRLRPN